LLGRGGGDFCGAAGEGLQRYARCGGALDESGFEEVDREERHLLLVNNKWS